MDIYFCDVCCARVNASHLSRGHGARNADVSVCGSCLEKGHGAELLLEAEKLEKVGAAPRLAGSEVLDAPRDRAVTMKNLDTATGDLDVSDDAATLGTEEELDELQVSLENDAQADALSLESDVHDDEPIDLGTDRDVSEVNDIEEPEPSLESVEDINVVDIDDVQEDDLIESDDDADVVEDLDDDALNFEAADGEDLSEPAMDLEEEPKPESSHISADDVVDDLDDSGVHSIPDEDRLEDADDDVHTDSYSADELAAIKRLAEKEKRKKHQSSVPAASSSEPRKASSTSSRRSTAASGRSKTKTSGRKKTSSRQKTANHKSSPQKSASKASGKSQKGSRKTSTRAKASKQPMPKPMIISFITIPIIIILFIMMIPGAKPVSTGPVYDDNVTGLTTMSNDVRNFANDAYNNGDLAQLYEAQKKIHEVMAKRDAVVARMEAAGTYSDSQFDKALAPFRKLMQLERALRDKIEETKSRTPNN